MLPGPKTESSKPGPLSTLKGILTRKKSRDSNDDQPLGLQADQSPSSTLLPSGTQIDRILQLRESLLNPGSGLEDRKAEDERRLRLLDSVLEEMRDDIAGKEAARKKDEAFREKAEFESCLRRLSGLNPDLQIAHMQEQEKSMEDLFPWILEKPEYQEFVDWEHQDPPAILRINGSMKTGKTRLLLDVVNDLKTRAASELKRPVLLCFFFNRTDEMANSGVAVLRSLLESLLRQQPQLFRHIRSHDLHSGKRLYTGQYAYMVLRDILEDMLSDDSLGRVVCILDAIDECKEKDARSLVLFLRRAARTLPNVKWIVSGRPHSLYSWASSSFSTIDLDSCDLSRPISIYIQRRIAQMKVELQDRDIPFDEEYMKQTEAKLQQKAGNTFLWVSIVCEKLSDFCANGLPIRVLFDEVITGTTDFSRLPEL